MNAKDIDLTGQVAFVTGGGGGIGRASALALAEMGADIAILESIQQRCDEAVTRIEAMGRKCMAICANAMEADAVRGAVKAAADKFGRIDVLVNNVGGVARKPFIELAEKNWRRHIDLNLVSHLAATTEAVPVMISGGRGGAVVNVSSIEGARAAPGYAVYAACKAGINNLTRTLALELAEHGIRVNSIAPDYTETPGVRGNFTGPVDESPYGDPSPERMDSIRRRTPLGRKGIDEECGMAAVFLASKMASYVTGTVMPVDGGTWASSGWIRDSKDNWILPPEVTD